MSISTRRAARPTWTDADEPSRAQLRRARWLRRGYLTVLAAIVLTAATGQLGVRTVEASDSRDGWELTVRYGRVTRPALATPWVVEVRRDGGFDGPIEVATTMAYFDLFDENGLDPDPAGATVDGDMLVWEFDPPEGDVLTVNYDARIEPAVQWGKSARTEVRADGAVVASVSYRTTVLP